MRYPGTATMSAMLSLASPLFLIAHNVRSAHNVGSMLRTADAFKVSRVLCTGYTPYPRLENDTRLGYEIEKLTGHITKTALGAEKTVPCAHYDSLDKAIKHLRGNYKLHIYALEQSAKSTRLSQARFHFPAVLIVGNEVDGLSAGELTLADSILEIPMLGSKESLNVSVAAGIALHEMRRHIL